MTAVRVPFDARSAALVRRRLVTELTSHGVPVEVIDDAALVASELVGNAVRHGLPLTDGCLRAAWRLGPALLHLEVTDGGTGVPEGLPTPTTSSGGTVDGAESGRGLGIVDLLTAGWGSRRTLSGVDVWADMRLLPRAIPHAEQGASFLQA